MNPVMYQIAQKDPKYELLRKNMQSTWWRLNHLYYILDDRGNKILFEPAKRPAQTFLFHNLHSRNIIVKSRQHGITTFFCILYLDIILFTPNIHAGIIADTANHAQAFLERKILYAYDNIPIKDIWPIPTKIKSNTQQLSFSNNASIFSDTSHRSGTLQLLHISELAKIAAEVPAKAREIKSGALNTVPAKDSMISIESTSRGTSGDFYVMAKLAHDKQLANETLTPLDFRSFFFGWQMKPECRLDQPVTIPKEHHDYFDELKTKHNIELTNPQKFWYVKTFEIQQDLMFQEYPSTWEESFQSSVIGGIYTLQMQKFREERRYENVLPDPDAPTYTAWDLGISDNMAIVVFQLSGDIIRVIDYYENSGEDITHYLEWLKAKPHKYEKHFAPHDVMKRDVLTGQTRLERANKDYGFKFESIEQTSSVFDDINFVRRNFYRVKIRQENCEKLIRALDNYRKEWNEKLGVFRDKPRHDAFSNACDAFRCMFFSLDKVATKIRKKITIGVSGNAGF